MKIIAFSWLTNTGKSTEINWDKIRDSIANEIENDGRRCLVYNETARDLFELLPNESNEIQDLTVFQTAIRAKEQARLVELQNRKDAGGDYTVLVDRPYNDSVLFNKYNRIIWLSDLQDWHFVDYSQDIYDLVVLFTEPYKDNWRLEQYNNDKFESIFISWTIEKYGDKVLQFKNNSDPEYLERKKRFFNL